MSIIFEDTIKTIRRRYVIYFSVVIFIIISLLNIYDVDIVNNTIKELPIKNFEIRLFPYFIISTIIVIFQYLLFGISLKSLKTAKDSVFELPISQLLGIPISYNKKFITQTFVYVHFIVSLIFYISILIYALKTHILIISLVVIILSNFFLFLLIYDLFIIRNIKQKWIPYLISTAFAFIILFFDIYYIIPGKFSFLNLNISHQVINDVNNKTYNAIVYSRDLSNRNFNGANFSNCVIINTNFSNSTFERANLINTDFSYSDFKNCSFKKAKLIYTNFQQDGHNNNFDGTTFFPDTIFYVNFNECNLEKTTGLKAEYFSHKREPSSNFLNNTIFPDTIIYEFTKDSINWNKYRIVISTNKFYEDTVSKYDSLF